METNIRNKCKAYTSLEQSRKLAEILPLKSADMSYSFNFNSEIYEISTVSYKSWIVPKYAQPDDGFGQVIPCWSLAALLNVLELPTLEKCNIGKDKTGWMVTVYHNNSRYDSFFYNEPVDACCEVILKLNELKML